MKTTHVFEAKGLGTAPFECVQVQSSSVVHTSCRYCGKGIANVFVIRDANGNLFHVGSDCVKRTGDKGLIDTVKREAARRRREATTVKREATIKELHTLVQTPRIRKSLAALPHPLPYFAGKGDTKLDHVEFLIANSSDKTRKALLKELKSTSTKV